ncbi:TetR/AcrR family transcriptional regulator [Priestia megaterium]|nr:TetR/AcrR family transcriptional regulator [Priestia megaterium]
MSNTRNKILEATFACIAEKGSSSTTLRDISKKAGVALSQIHYYFTSKEGLMLEATFQFINDEQKRIKEYLKDIKDPSTRIEKAADYLREQQTANPTLQKVYVDLLTMSMWNPAMAEKTKELQEMWINSIVEEEFAFGISNRAVARFIVAFLDGLALQALQGAPKEELDQAYSVFRETIINTQQH